MAASRLTHLAIVYRCLCLTAYICRVTGCGENKTGSSGTVTSPGYPNNYNDNLDCDYNIDAGTTLIRLVFVDFVIETCCDYVSVYDASGNLLGELTGDKDWYTIEPSRYYRLHFHTDVNEVARGFNATWTVAAAHLAQDIDAKIHAPCDYNVTNFVRKSTSGLTLSCLETLTTSTIYQCLHICMADWLCAAWHHEGEVCSLFLNRAGNNLPEVVYMQN
ncbi:protein SpAN-like [Haliotis cracherodii]|uniref:protein SpAN-like n=1 Tax=Haliotis cracherodii TaxID=6455 RepID=UPI0039EC5A8A